MEACHSAAWNAACHQLDFGSTASQAAGGREQLPEIPWLQVSGVHPTREGGHERVRHCFASLRFLGPGYQEGGRWADRPARMLAADCSCSGGEAASVWRRPEAAPMDDLDLEVSEPTESACCSARKPQGRCATFCKATAMT